MIEFKHRILMTGFGVVAQATLPMLLKHLRVPGRNITVIDFQDREDVLRPWLSRGARFIRLDAIAFLWKEIGTTCLHLPQTHSIIQLMRAVLNETAPHVLLITETWVLRRVPL